MMRAVRKASAYVASPTVVETVACSLTSSSGLGGVGALAPVVNTVSQRYASQRVRDSAADLYATNSKFAAVLGAQWGDEGKGKLVDILAAKFDTIARFNGGANAGHTLVVGGKKFPFHLLPCGMLYENKLNVIGNGVVVDINKMFDELQNLWNAGFNTEGRLAISDRAHIVLDIHKVIDGQLETQAKANAIGTTRRGIGPTYSSKATRDGLRMCDIAGDWSDFVTKYDKLVDSRLAMYGIDPSTYDKKTELDKLKEKREKMIPWITDTVCLLNGLLHQGKSVLAEGANACLLDIDFGTYPYVTSSSTTVGGVGTGLGVSPTKLGSVIGVVKAYTTRVGSGPFPTEEMGEVGAELCKLGHEFGTTTGRPRRCGWLDIPVLRYSNFINGYTSINITKLDVLSTFPVIKVGVGYKGLPPGHMPATLEGLANVEVEYVEVPGWQCDISKAKTFEELPARAQDYIKLIEEQLGVPVSYVGVGPGRDEMLKI